MHSLKRTPLYEAHQQQGARFVEFGGWEMPIQYSSIVDEHLAVRRTGGIFDISHMGEITVSGPGAAAWLNQVLTNDIRKLTPGLGQYTLLCNEQGGVIDDLYVYHLEEQKYLLIVNASRVDADWDWLQTQYDVIQTRDGLQVRNDSSLWGALAVQGPQTPAIMDEAIPGGSIGGRLVSCISELAKNELGTFVFHGTTIHVARTGYTGEDGFEIVAPNEALPNLWEMVLRTGQPRGLQPAGLGARDTLRTEVCYPLYGQELNESTTPIEAGLGFFVALDKGDFIGRTTLLEQKDKGPLKRCVAFIMQGKTPPPRPHYPILSAAPASAVLGEVSSGTQSPSLNQGIGLGYVHPDHAKPGTSLQIEIRGRLFPAEVVRKPIFKRPTS